MRAYAKAGGQILFGTDVGYMSDYDPTEEYRLMARALVADADPRLADDRARGALEGKRRVAAASPRGWTPTSWCSKPTRRRTAANFAKVRCTIRAGRVLYAREAAE